MSNSTDKTKDADSGKGSNTARCYVMTISWNALNWDVYGVKKTREEATKAVEAYTKPRDLHYRITEWDLT
jgi:hypothetical protein